MAASDPPTTAFDPIVVVPDRPTGEAAELLKMGDMIPPLRGFRAPILQAADDPWPIGPDPAENDSLRSSRRIVATNLATRGLIWTTAAAIREHGAAAFTTMSPAQQRRHLRKIGIPADLLSHFGLSDNPIPASTGDRITLSEFSRRVSQIIDDDAIDEFAHRFTFSFRPTNPRFRVVAESGEMEIGEARVQFTRGDDWLGQGDGGCVDIVRQFASEFKSASIVASIQDLHLPTLLDTARDWRLTGEPPTLIVVPYPLAQWAQDNAKAGVQVGLNGKPETTATLAPRYASRRDEVTVFVPGESQVIDALSATGGRVFQSSLLFQGGNLLAVREPKTGRTILLVGEAEIARNVALGLSVEQATTAFTAEFGVDETRILPSVSFHVDYDVSVRAVDGRLTAFVQDVPAGAKLVLAAGIRAMRSAERITVSDADGAIAALEANDPDTLLKRIAPALARGVDRAGHFSESFARTFSISPTDSHVGNLRIFLVAMDSFVHRVVRSSNADTRAYLESFSRLDADRNRLHQLIESWGWKVVPVPCVGEGERAINPLNGIHTTRQYLMPAIGGLYAALDDSASAIFQRELGSGVEIVPIRCAESQRRAGALHCSVAVYPKLDDSNSTAAEPE
ncbi:MAG: hypothetical protein KF841_00690 [Phycisphaerae bacterium]|nr:hypothetical protein [Phycisphaerae bacterium]